MTEASIPSGATTPLPAAVALPGRGKLPVLLSVPHSGRDYPDWLIALSKQGRSALTALEDPLVDRLIWRAVDAGIGAVIAQTPRAAVDCNRSENDIDPSVIHGTDCLRPSARARGGLGVVPGRTHQHGFLWRRSIGRNQLEERLAQAHRPYHQCLADTLAMLSQKFGGAVLLDCHSMPSPGRGVPPIVIGDRHGRSAASWLAAEAIRLAEEAGYAARLNDPFAGGHIVDRHGRPELGVHALQIEIDRACYLDQGGAPGPGFDRVARLLAMMAVGLGNVLLDRLAPAIAAE